jgi:phosphoglycerate dehydrogenase-like enzyme
VSLHIAGAPGNRHFVDSGRLATIPPNAWFINTARGFLVDEDALFDALSSGTIAGACLDVLEAEPYQPIHPQRDLRTLDNVIMLPHCGSSTLQACTRMARRAVENIRLAELAQYDKMDLLNPEVLVAIGAGNCLEARP